jgi:hypothetical protein
MPKSASRPAKAETQAGAPPLSASTARATCSDVKIAVILILTPSCDNERSTSSNGSRRAVVTGSLTRTFFP